MEQKLCNLNTKADGPRKKNWALENLPFCHEWVLILDADECLPPEAEEEIRKLFLIRMKNILGIG